MKTKIEGVNIEIPEELIEALIEKGVDPIEAIRQAIQETLEEKDAEAWRNSIS